MERKPLWKACLSNYKNVLVNSTMVARCDNGTLAPHTLHDITQYLSCATFCNECDVPYCGHWSQLRNLYEI